ncbi:MAG: hypothetical protein N3D20_01625 [Candidatus Pacearchaeota archaeon]|nr:hypothetical protein [Candidatus Pacearchaeota archaeon]
MKRGLFGFILALILALTISKVSAVYIGLTDGYVYNNLGSPVGGAFVEVSVSGCSGGYANGCKSNATTGSNGYYIASNLNLPKNGGVSVIARKDSGSGSATGNANEYQVARVNLTICYPPSVPLVSDVPNGDNNTIMFSWTSGTDPLGLTKHDDFILDSVVTSPATPPLMRSNLSFTSHTWGARTCNPYCCSNWATDSFTLNCPAPTQPTLTDVPNSHNTTVTFAWVSGIDPYNRPTYDEFDLNGNITSPAVSPITRINLGFISYIWKVRTCNNYCCSNWVSDSFTLGNGAPSKPTNTNFSVNNITGKTNLTWNSGVDPDGDATYDEIRLENGTIISPATSPYEINSKILIEWEVRTCDSFGACSDWVEVDSVTCAEITGVCESCPVCEVCEPCEEKGGSTGGGKKTTTSEQKTSIVCNGVEIKNDLLLKVEMRLNGKNNKISLFGSKWAWEDLQYCPWCYDGIKNYDEEGVDCGGSCRECSLIEQPFKRKGIPLATVIVIITLIIVIVYISYQFNLWTKTKILIKKILLRILSSLN